ncbi:hypothetical protein [Jiella mangrovi]|uniref:50S ribosomal protein L4 n=1 Tax=Jiella mangrovi TaxID=2821407 RepID=A0ABS4BHV0_9HYPH|nr:hypothetical protein [Jiella mangrovi]MBP0615756.1 hypothetical protein [Jiella mangrovi]
MFDAINFDEQEMSFGSSSLLKKAASVNAGNKVVTTGGRRGHRAAFRAAAFKKASGSRAA